MTTNREQLELAAKAMGYPLGYTQIKNGEGIAGFWVVIKGDPCYWNPADDQANSDWMACDLCICTTWYLDCVGCVARENMYFVGAEHRVPHDNTLEGKCAAVREARLLVAVEIGRAK